MDQCFTEVFLLYSFFSAFYNIMAYNKNFVIDDKKLDELGDKIIQTIESYIDKKLRLILDKIKEKKEYYELNFL